MRDVYISKDYIRLVKSQDDQLQENDVKVIAGEKLKFEPGTNKSYSNSGYYLLGAIASKMKNKSFASVVTGRIFNSLGMNNSGFAKTGEFVSNHAVPYEFKRGKAKKIGVGLVGDPPSGEGSEYSSASDLLKVYYSVVYDNVLLSDDSNGLLFNDSEPANWHEIKNSGKLFGFIGGDTRGWSAKITFYFLKEKNYGVIIVSNYDNMAHELDLKLRPFLMKD